MNSNELLAELETHLRRGDISPKQVQHRLQAAGADADDIEAEPSPPTFGSTRILYIIGGVFVALGLGYLGTELWGGLTPVSRVLITLGIGLVLAGSGSLMLLSEPESGLGTVFHAIAGVMIPGGVTVTLAELGRNLLSPWWNVLAVAVLFLFYLILSLAHRRALLGVFAFVNGTALLYLCLDAALPLIVDTHYAYLTMVIGVSYLVFSQALTTGWTAPLSRPLRFFGTAGIYLGAFSQVSESLVMELLFPLLACAGLVASVSLIKSRQILVLSTLAVIAYVIYVTAEYFANSLGWPVALIALGFGVIALGYLSLTLNRRYLVRQSIGLGKPIEKATAKHTIF